MDSSVDYALSSCFVASGTTSEWSLVDSETEHVDFSKVLLYKHFRDSKVGPGGIEDGLWWNLKRKMLIFHLFYNIV